MYRYDSRIRYSEIGEDGKLTLTAAIHYLQDCSTFQSEDCGVGIKYLETAGKAWMLSSWRILLYRYPEFGERITVGTWPYGNRGIYGYRNFVIEDEAGQRLAEADSTWFLLDWNQRVPCRVTEADVGPYGAPGSRIEMEPVPRKILLSSSCEEGQAITVSSHHIDTNHHVNNAQYVEMAREAAGSRFPIGELRVDYKKAAVLGDVIYPKIGRKDDEVTVALQNSRKEAYAVVWMKEQKKPDKGRRGKEKND